MTSTAIVYAIAHGTRQEVAGEQPQRHRDQTNSLDTSTSPSQTAVSPATRSPDSCGCVERGQPAAYQPRGGVTPREDGRELPPS